MRGAEHLDYPVCLQLRGRRVVVVGGGDVAAGRVVGLAAAGARVVVVSPDVVAGIAALVDAGVVIHEARVAVASDVDGAGVVFVAPDDEAVSVAVAAAARARGVLVNTADVKGLCDFTLPSVGRRGPITVAVSTSGEAPALARALRQTLTAQVSRRHEALARVIGFLRRRLPRGPARMRLLSSVVDGDAGALLLSGDRRAAFRALRKALAA
jgi:precorrin-2 dehydrogenase/sirohydrochlorin ferrochelatase